MPARAQQGRLKTATLPAPAGGLNTSSDGGAMEPTDCLALWNMVASEYGLRTRLGYREWATGLDGQVRSLLPYAGTKRDGSGAQLFACTQTGIWKVTTRGAKTTADRVVTFAVQNGDSGWGSSTAFVTNAGGYLAYCDESNGYHLYAENGQTWTKITRTQMTEATGVSTPPAPLDPTTLAFVLAWKNMLWFVERDTGRAWYLPVGLVTGTGPSGAQPFNFGGKFKSGSDLRALYSWTFDGGSGVDDALVAISSGGDVLAYKGSDPTQPSGFYQVGCWFVGGIPAGRRIATETGGDLLLMTSLGLLPLSTLTGGALLTSGQYVTAKVGNLFNQLATGARTLRGWAARLHPLDNTLMLLAPQAVGQPSQQLVMSTLNKSWSRYRDVPIGVCAEAWNGTLAFGTEDGRVCFNDGYLDGVNLAGTTGDAIRFSLLTTFQDLGRPTNKRVQLIRPTFMSQGAQPRYVAEARYAWDLGEAEVPPLLNPTSGSFWDVGVWDTSRWAAGGYQAQRKLFGAMGVGTQAALAIAGSSSARMTLVGIEVAYDEGGIL